MVYVDRWIWQRRIVLGDCLKSHFSAEQLIDNNAYRCDHCNRYILLSLQGCQKEILKLGFKC